MKWKNIKISTKLITVFLAIGIISIAVLGIISFSESSNALNNSAKAKLSAVREIKKNQINSFFNERVADIEVYSANTALQMAADRFISAFDTAGLNSSVYQRWEQLHGPKLNTYVNEYEYYDLFIISTDGDVAYTVAKESDLGKNVASGSLSGSPLAEAFQNGKDQAALTDFAWYNVSNEPAAFVSAPITNDEGTKMGVLVYQISLDAINSIMQERSGLGETGETYLVGPDNRMRSDSYLDQENRSVEASFQGTVSSNGVNTEATQEALAGRSGTKFITDYRGETVLSSYAPVQFGNITWGLMAEIDQAEIMQPVNRLGNEILILALIMAVVIVIVSVIFARSIANPINKGVAFAQKLSRGDLTATVDVDQNDEIGTLANALKDMSAKLKEVVTGIQTGANNIASASQQVSSSSQQMSQGSNEQASAAEEVSSSMEQMTSNIQQNSDNAKETEQIAQKATEGIKEGNQAAQTSVQSMKEIAEKISIINDIAYQTNILALNAAVEAARAGEHGRGFSVVASEIRKLAERSSEAAKEIDEKSRSGVEISQKAGKQLDEIVPEIEKTTRLVQEITASTTEMNNGSSQVNSSVQQLNQVTQQNASSSEELATNAEELSGQADQLKRLVGFFKIEQDGSSNLPEQSKSYNVNMQHLDQQSNTQQANQPTNTQQNQNANVKTQQNQPAQTGNTANKGKDLNLDNSQKDSDENYEQY